jgi:hypothetical protein
VMGKLLQMKRDAYNYRPISAQSLIRKMLPLIDQIFPNVHRQYTIHDWLAIRAILAAKKCGRRQIESQDITIVTRRFSIIQIY